MIDVMLNSLKTRKDIFKCNTTQLFTVCLKEMVAIILQYYMSYNMNNNDINTLNLLVLSSVLYIE